MSDILDKIKENLIAGRVDSQDEGFSGDMEGQPGVIELVHEAIDKNISPSDILTRSLKPGMEEVGKLYENGEYLIPDMLASAECVGEAMDVLKPLLVKEDVEKSKKFVIATVEGDLHDIGKNIVATLLQGSGFDVIDMGSGVKAEKIVDKVKETNAQYLGLSSLLTTTMEHMKEVIEKLEEEKIREKVKVVIGGAPVSEEFAQKIGADYYCDDAFDAIEKLS
ncbi:MAG: corrinoid protein [Candidatus Hodarchaeota archaeon]